MKIIVLTYLVIKIGIQPMYSDVIRPTNLHFEKNKLKYEHHGSILDNAKCLNTRNESFKTRTKANHNINIVYLDLCY